MALVDNLQRIAKGLTPSGGDGGVPCSSDGRLDIGLSVSGIRKIGALPEQLLAAAWSVRLAPSVEIVAGRIEVKQMPELAIDAEVDLCRHGDGLFLQAKINIDLLGIQSELGSGVLQRIEAASETEAATAA